AGVVAVFARLFVRRDANASRWLRCSFDAACNCVPGDGLVPPRLPGSNQVEPGLRQVFVDFDLFLGYQAAFLTNQAALIEQVVGAVGSTCGRGIRNRAIGGELNSPTIRNFGQATPGTMAPFEVNDAEYALGVLDQHVETPGDFQVPKICCAG